MSKGRCLNYQKKFTFLMNFLKQSRKKNFAIQVLIQLVREGQIRPLAAVKDIQSYGIYLHTPECQQALIEIAKLAAQRNGLGTSLYIQKFGIDASSPEGRRG